VDPRKGSEKREFNTFSEQHTGKVSATGNESIEYNIAGFLVIKKFRKYSHKSNPDMDQQNIQKI